MLQQVNYNQIIQTINRLNYSDKKKLFNHLKRLINSDNKTRPAKNSKNMSWLGCLEGQTEFQGDIIAPVMPETEWEVLS